MPQAIFINYRGEDSHMSGPFLYHVLSGLFGESRVFFDSSSIRPGDDFEKILIDRLRRSSVLLAVIGPRWLTATDGFGRRCIASPGDWVRRELVLAFELDLRVIPVLIDNTGMPRLDELPADIAALSRRQYVRLRRRHTEQDLGHLMDTLADLDPYLVWSPRKVRIRDQRRGSCWRQRRTLSIRRDLTT